MLQYIRRLHILQLSLFEKVILVNGSMMIAEAGAGLWITSHSLESQHYLIDTSFIVGATALSLGLTYFLLRASFRPLFSLLATIRAISAGQTEARAKVASRDSEIGEMAGAFNGMLNRLEQVRREQGIMIVQAQEDERRRVALELHDESSQNLTALLVHTEILQQTLQSLPPSALAPEARSQLQGGLGQLTRLSQQTLESLRVLALQLRPAVLDDLGLPAALRYLAEDARERLHLEVELALPASPGAYPPMCETTLFRVAQECLTNIARHAQASRVWLQFSEDENGLELRVRDNGRGFDPQHRRPGGLGVRGMRERLGLLQGTLRLCSEPGQGTTVAARLPLKPGLVQEAGTAHERAGQTKEGTYA